MGCVIGQHVYFGKSFTDGCVKCISSIAPIGAAEALNNKNNHPETFWPG